MKPLFLALQALILVTISGGCAVYEPPYAYDPAYYQTMPGYPAYTASGPYYYPYYYYPPAFSFGYYYWGGGHGHHHHGNGFAHGHGGHGGHGGGHGHH